MKIKKNLKIPIHIYSAMLLLLFLLLFLISKCSGACPINYCSSGYSFSLTLSIFMADLLRVFFAMLFWLISPIGILFLLGIKLFFSEKASVLKRNFALLLQFFSFLSWSSLMFILLVVYIDSIFYHILNLGGSMLNLAIKSGFAFVILMIMLALAENKIINDRSYKPKSIKSKKNNPRQNKEDKNDNESAKIIGTKTVGIKNRVKNKIKKEIKKIINNRIDKL
ncbi:MAG: hypothetical protein KAS78_04655 [Candidatus Pacebacteria bacterium]|nr:hypothetical protein [Candidatus Paceibacterota bacterium]